MINLSSAFEVITWGKEPSETAIIFLDKDAWSIRTSSLPIFIVTNVGLYMTYRSKQPRIIGVLGKPMRIIYYYESNRGNKTITIYSVKKSNHYYTIDRKKAELYNPNIKELEETLRREGLNDVAIMRLTDFIYGGVIYEQ